MKRLPTAVCFAEKTYVKLKDHTSRNSEFGEAWCFILSKL